MLWAKMNVKSITTAVAVAVIVATVPTLTQASVLTYYADRSSFDSAAPGLSLEDFQPITDPGFVTSPLSNSTNNVDFQAGNILAGITFSMPAGIYVFNGALSTFYFAQTLIATALPARWRVSF